jgi:polysaccharide biosynthesis/export protein
MTGTTNRSATRKLPWKSAALGIAATLSFLLVVYGSPAVSQVPIGGGTDTIATPAPGERRPPPLLDAPVERSEYVLGPGDRIEISIVGELNRTLPLTVSPEGSVVVPAMGVVNVRGRSLDQTEADLRRLIGRFHRNVAVHVTLVEVRRFRMFVVGDVETRGAREASATTRVSEVVPPDPDAEAPRRNVTIRRLNGDSIVADLRRFNQTGHLASNPLLREGDVVVVPSADETVQVVGRVRFPGLYQYRHGETLQDLVEIANGGIGFPRDAGDTIRIARYRGPADREVFAVPRAELSNWSGPESVLQPFDAIYVPWFSNFMEQSTATIRGQVVRPGSYPIRSDTTTIREMLALAGGVTGEAALGQATLRRDPEGLQNEALQRLAEIPDELRTPDERRILQVGMAGDQSRVVADFRLMFSGTDDALDQTMRTGDVIEVPMRRNEVLVLGAVLRPGLVSHSHGIGAASFVRMAGGFARRADRRGVVVLKADTGARVGLREARFVEPGDAIIVPYQERVSALQVVQTTGVVVSTVTSMILAYIAISNR